MSITDPLIKELKVYTIKLTQEIEENSVITDSSEYLLPLCTTLEGIFQKGFIGLCWDWLEEINHEMAAGIINKSFSYMRAVDTTKACQKTKTSTGRLRLLIRCCLVNKCLHVPVELVVRSYMNCGKQWFNSKCSILGDEILGEIFLSVVLQLSTWCFKLDISNARFLDSTFLLPHCVQVEFVPCNSLGVAVAFIDDKALVVQVDEKSVAAEDNQIQVGDVLDELNGQVLRGEMRGKLNSLMNKSKCKPITVRIIKSLNNDESIYAPIIPLLRKANIDIFDVKKQVLNEKNIEGPTIIRGGPKVKFIGSVATGAEGDVKQIEYAVSCLLFKKVATESTTVYFECQELGIKVISEATGKIMFQNSFMEISSCGQTRKYPNYFAYIAGDNICNIATKFTCYVFHTENENDIQTILQSIGQGTHRHAPTAQYEITSPSNTLDADFFVNERVQMGRKIPGKKHRTVKDPYKQQQKRLESLSSKINNPPSNADDQEIPKSLLEIMALKKKANEKVIRKRRRRKTEEKERSPLSVAKFFEKEPIPKGAVRPDKFIPNLVQKPHESAKRFLERVSAMTKNLVNEVEFEKKFGIEIKKDQNTGEVIEIKNVRKKNSKSKKKKLTEKRKEKLNQKKENLKNVKDFSQLKDKVEFGEVVHRPPELKATNKKNLIPKNKYSNLLLNNVVKSAPTISMKSSSVLEKEKAENERKFIVEAYRKLKNFKRN